MTETIMSDLKHPQGGDDAVPRSTLLQYVKARRFRLSSKELSQIGQILAARCRTEGIDLPKVEERGGWRKTNLYPRALLEAWEEQRPIWEAEWHQTRAARREVRIQEGEAKVLNSEPGPLDDERP